MHCDTTTDIELTGSFDRCLTCPFLGNGCSGPRTNAMTYERHLHWLRELRLIRKEQGWKVSFQDIADACDLSKTTVDNLFSGKTKDVSRETMGRIENYLVSGNASNEGAKWPCAMDIEKGKEIVYHDRPETLDALEQLRESNLALQKTLDGIHESYGIEMQKIRDESKKTIEYLVEENKQKSKIIERLLS